MNEDPDEGQPVPQFEEQDEAPAEDPTVLKEFVKVVRVNKAKINYFFTERPTDIAPIFERGEVELRITVGKKWDNYIAVNKTPLLKQFRNFQFSRSSETHYSRNLMLFSDNLEGMNLRMTLGIALDKQTDISDVKEDTMQTYLTDKILFPPPHFSNNDIHMNILPQKWFLMLSNDRTPLI